MEYTKDTHFINTLNTGTQVDMPLLKIIFKKAPQKEIVTGKLLG